MLRSSRPVGAKSAGMRPQKGNLRGRVGGKKAGIGLLEIASYNEASLPLVKPKWKESLTLDNGIPRVYHPANFATSGEIGSRAMNPVDALRRIIGMNPLGGGHS